MRNDVIEKLENDKIKILKEKNIELKNSSEIESQINDLKENQSIRENLDLSRFIGNTEIKKIDENSFLLFFKGVSFFNSGSVDLLPGAKLAISEVAKKVMPYLSEYKVIVYAYTDQTPVNQSRHRFRDNIELSALRSISVLRELFTMGVDKNKVEITGRGILPDKALGFMNIDPQDKQSVQAMQRTVAFVLKRAEGK